MVIGRVLWNMYIYLSWHNVYHREDVPLVMLVVLAVVVMILGVVVVEIFTNIT